MKGLQAQWMRFYRVLLGIFIFTLCFSPNIQSQTAKVDLQMRLTINFENESVPSLLNTLGKKTKIKFLYKESELISLPSVLHSFTDATLDEILNHCFENTRYTYNVVNNTIIIERRTNVERITIFGVITDHEKIPLPGASVSLKGTTIGVSADHMGRYSISFGASKNMTLVYAFMGQETRELTVKNSAELNVSLKNGTIEMNDVVVDGVFTRNKETYTGAATTMTGEDILAISNTNLLKAIATLTPDMIIVENNAQGANPNAIPEILIRGATNIVTSEEEKAYNNPLIILDGVEITIQELYDLDMYDIQRVNVLKDASATLLYGNKAANGVIVVERNRVRESKVRLNYNFVPNVSIADLSSMNFTNAEQKLEVERLAGLYTTDNGSRDRAYAHKLQNVRRGVDTDWRKAPLRTAFTHNHSVSMAGRGQSVDYRAALNFKDAYGVMKGDNRQNYSLNFRLGYHISDKMTTSFTSTYNRTESKNTPYGNYSDYTKMNPYETIYDENGDFIKYYDFDPFNPATSGNNRLLNPLYNATLSSFSKTYSQTMRNSLDLKWYITKLFFITGQLTYEYSNNQSDNYTSPDHSKYASVTLASEKGYYSLGGSKGSKYQGKLAINYTKQFDNEGTGVSFRGSGDISSSNSENFRMAAKGFLKDKLDDISFAMIYDRGGPSGNERISRNVAFYLGGSFVYKNRYFTDLAYTISGSSSAGRNNRYTPLWSIGQGWNIHKESFMKDLTWINTLRLSGSWGFTGTPAGGIYDAMTTYRYGDDLFYYSGIGALPIKMGNPDLKSAKSFKQNYGIRGVFLKERINFSFDYYVNTTKDLTMAIALPASVGAQNMIVNIGENKNSGISFSINGQIVKNQNMLWTMTLTGAHNFDQIKKISTALKNLTYQDVNDPTKPKLEFKEGGSQYDIYAVRSAGIDPATGKEIFIKKNGEYTYDYDKNDRVAVGNTNPILNGTWNNSLRYKSFSINIATNYEFGADFYNTTVRNKVERIDPLMNVDVRAYTDRWKNPGDLSRYLAIGKFDDIDSERFIERRNEIYISSVNFDYQVPESFAKKFKMHRLIVGFGLSDVVRISTVKFERGTSYPYTRAINLTFKPTF